MIYDSIKRNIFAIITHCVFIILLIWGGCLLLQPGNEIIVDTNTMPLMQLCAKWLFHQFWFMVAMGAWVVLIIAILLYRLNEVHLFITKREALPPILFVLLMSAFSNTHHLLGVHLALLLTIFSLDYIFQTYRREYAFREVFMAALCLSSATLFYAPIIYFLLGLIICIALMKPLLWRDFAVIIAGLLIPYIIALFYYYFADGDWQIPFLLLADNLELKAPTGLPVFSTTEWIYIIYTSILSFTAIFRLMFLPSLGAKIKTIRINIVFIWMFLISVFCCIFYSTPHSNESLLIISLPATVLIANFFSSLKSNKTANYLFLLLIFSIIAIQIPLEFYTAIANVANNTWECIWGFIINFF